MPQRSKYVSFDICRNPGGWAIWKLHSKRNVASFIQTSAIFEEIAGIVKPYPVTTDSECVAARLRDLDVNAHFRSYD
jgi:hypothetical protein